MMPHLGACLDCDLSQQGDLLQAVPLQDLVKTFTAHKEGEVDET